MLSSLCPRCARWSTNFLRHMHNDLSLKAVYLWYDYTQSVENLQVHIHFEWIYLIVTKLYNILKYVIMHVDVESWSFAYHAKWNISKTKQENKNVSKKLLYSFQWSFKLTPSIFESYMHFNTKEKDRISIFQPRLTERFQSVHENRLFKHQIYKFEHQCIM
jgi:hypothetical protein